MLAKCLIALPKSVAGAATTVRGGPPHRAGGLRPWSAASYGLGSFGDRSVEGEALWQWVRGGGRHGFGARWRVAPALRVLTVRVYESAMVKRGGL
jgi:hypothetical protein